VSASPSTCVATTCGGYSEVLCPHRTGWSLASFRPSYSLRCGFRLERLLWVHALACTEAPRAPGHRSDREVEIEGRVVVRSQTCPRLNGLRRPLHAGESFFSPSKSLRPRESERPHRSFPSRRRFGCGLSNLVPTAGCSSSRASSPARLPRRCWSLLPKPPAAR
jgi:hypothetical protein